MGGDVKEDDDEAALVFDGRDSKTVIPVLSAFLLLGHDCFRSEEVEDDVGVQASQMLNAMKIVIKIMRLRLPLFLVPFFVTNPNERKNIPQQV